MAETIERQTIASAITKLDHLLGAFDESADHLERIADRLDGPAVSQAGASPAPDHPPSSVIEILHRQISALQIMRGRMSTAAGRIDNSLGGDQPNKTNNGAALQAYADARVNAFR